MEPSEEDILEVRQRAIEKIESPEQGNLKWIVFYERNLSNDFNFRFTVNCSP